MRTMLVGRCSPDPALVSPAPDIASIQEGAQHFEDWTTEEQVQGRVRAWFEVPGGPCQPNPQTKSSPS